VTCAKPFEPTLACAVPRTGHAEVLVPVLAGKEEVDRDGYVTSDELLMQVEARLAQRVTSAT